MFCHSFKLIVYISVFYIFQCMFMPFIYTKLYFIYILFKVLDDLTSPVVIHGFLRTCEANIFIVFSGAASINYII